MSDRTLLLPEDRELLERLASGRSNGASPAQLHALARAILKLEVCVEASGVCVTREETAPKAS